MKKLRLYACLFLILAFIHHARAQSGWSCDPHDYQFDMTVYPSIVKQNGGEVDLSKYEVAAFVGDECRGVAEVLTTSTSKQYLYLRVRSNTSSGENLTFKVYDITAGKEVSVTHSALTFESNATQGQPSNPFVITFEGSNVLLGDINGDGRINATDVRLLINRRFNRTMPAGYIEAACDLNGDGRINAIDVRLIINLRFNR